MTAPAVQVFIGFEATGTLGTFFTLDDPTRGLLDDPTYLLADSTIFTDVTDHLSGQVGVTRGRSREVDQFQAGTAQFTLRNEDRSFDPSNTSSPYYPSVGPRAQVQILLAGQTIFTGFTDDVSVTYEQPNICTTTFTCVDAFTLLANMSLSGYTVSAAMPGAVINAVLNHVGFPATRYIAAGYSQIQASTPTGDALQYLQSVAASEPGMLFVDRSGVLTFADRYGIKYHGSPRAYLGSYTFTDVTSDPDLANGQCGYVAISQASQALLLYNIVTGSVSGGPTKTATNAASVSRYFGRTLTLSQLENNRGADIQGICDWLAAIYSSPEVRFDSITVDLQGLTDTGSAGLYGAAKIAALDIGCPVTVDRTPPGTGTPSTISIDSVIEGISYSLDVSSSSYLVTFSLALDQRTLAFTLDDPVLGVLDSALLSF